MPSGTKVQLPPEGTRSTHGSSGRCIIRHTTSMTIMLTGKMARFRIIPNVLSHRCRPLPEKQPTTDMGTPAIMPAAAKRSAKAAWPIGLIPLPGGRGKTRGMTNKRSMGTQAQAFNFRASTKPRGSLSTDFSAGFGSSLLLSEDIVLNEWRNASRILTSLANYYTTPHAVFRAKPARTQLKIANDPAEKTANARKTGANQAILALNADTCYDKGVLFHVRDADANFW